MPKDGSIHDILARGDRRSVAGVSEALALVERSPNKLGEVISCLDDPNPGVCMRAADLLEKLSRREPGRLTPLKPHLLRLLAEATQKEVRWHLAVLVPRLPLTPSERVQVAHCLKTYFDDRSSIVKTFAMQGLFDLSQKEPSLHSEVLDLIRISTRSGTPAMRARGRILLRELESQT